jgi:hypothetical protein
MVTATGQGPLADRSEIGSSRSRVVVVPGARPRRGPWNGRAVCLGSSWSRPRVLGSYASELALGDSGVGRVARVARRSSRSGCSRRRDHLRDGLRAQGRIGHPPASILVMPSGVDYADKSFDFASNAPTRAAPDREVAQTPSSAVVSGPDRWPLLVTQRVSNVTSRRFRETRCQ